MALAIAILAVIAVLPEYAADLDFALSGQISLVLGFAPLGFFAFYLWKASVTGPGRGPRSPPLTGVISGRFELHPAWNMEPPRRRVSGSSAGERGPYVAALVPQDTKGAGHGSGQEG